LYSYLEAWNWTPLKTFLIGLLDGAVDVGEVDAMLSLFKQPNSMPITDIKIHIQLYEQHFLFLERNRSQRKSLIKKSSVSRTLFIRHLGILRPATQTPFINVWCRKNYELSPAPPRSQHCTRFMLAMTSASRWLSGVNSLAKWDHGSAPPQPKQVHFCASLNHAPMIRNASTVQAHIPKLLRKEKNSEVALASGDIRDISTQPRACEISAFRDAVDENSALLGYYARCSNNSLPTFRDRSWILDPWRWDRIGCPRQSVRTAITSCVIAQKSAVLFWPCITWTLCLRIQLVPDTQHKTFFLNLGSSDDEINYNLLPD